MDRLHAEFLPDKSGASFLKRWRHYIDNTMNATEAAALYDTFCFRGRFSTQGITMELHDDKD